MKVGILRNNVMSGFYSSTVDGDALEEYADTFQNVKEAEKKASELNDGFPEGSQAVICFK